MSEPLSVEALAEMKARLAAATTIHGDGVIHDRALLDNAPTDMAALIAEVERLQGENERFEGTLIVLRDDVCTCTHRPAGYGRARKHYSNCVSEIARTTFEASDARD